MTAVKRFYPPALLLLSLLAALAFSLLVVIAALDPPAQDIQQLFVFMLSTGGASIGLAYLMYRGGVMQRFNSLRWVLLATIVLTVLLTLVNVWVTAHLMFINEHDFILTTVLLIFAGCVSVVAVFFISGALIERIHALARAAQRLGAGDLQTRLDVQGNDEVAELAKMFNHMASALQTLDKQKRQLEQTRRDLIAWVSHDLRTPLASIQAMNEAVIDGVVTDPQTIARYSQNIQREVQHLSRMIDDLFALSKLDTGRVELAREKTSLRDLISDTLSSLEAQAHQSHIALTGEVAPDADMVYIAPDKIQRVLYNLLDNALQHTPAGGKAHLRARRAGAHIRIDIHNTGPAITPDDLPHIFESFYRGERARTQEHSGRRSTGLGLAIARGFVEAHGGKITVESASAGTTFTFTLPVDL